MRRTAITAIAVSAVITGAIRAVAQDVATSPPVVRLLVSNRAKLRPEMLKAAEDDAATIYRIAGIETSWVNAGPADAHDEYAVDFIVMIISGSEARVLAPRSNQDVMGFAVRDTNDPARPGGIAFVLVDRVEAGATSHHVSISRVLGQVIAHELGHLLLPANSHSERGIMRAAFNLRSGLLEHFTPAQSEMIRRRLAVPDRNLREELPMVARLRRSPTAFSTTAAHHRNCMLFTIASYVGCKVPKSACGAMKIM